MKKLKIAAALAALTYAAVAAGASTGGIRTVTRSAPSASPAKAAEAPKAPEPVAAPKTEAPKKEEPKKQEAPAPEPEPAPAAPTQEELDREAEYERSVGDVHVSIDTFEADKREIMRKIDELSIIIEDKNYAKWLNYIDSESRSYWTKVANLKKAQGKLPIKGLQLKTLEDYFKYVFVPSRRDRSITEIRYISDKSVKAIEIEESQDVVYYYFQKEKGEWKVHLPPND